MVNVTLAKIVSGIYLLGHLGETIFTATALRHVETKNEGISE